jgi:8-oxo-dGTP pyrophosphatase MutT (NUDIX family)
VVEHSPNEEGTIAIPSGTVAVIRDGQGGGIEVLMLRRSSHERDTFSGMWVFPGGKVDDADRRESAEEQEAARIAAVRETLEEADLHLSLDSLHAIDRWEPEREDGQPRRFSAWIFLAPAGEGAVTVDGIEIHEHDWVSPADALARHAADEMGIVPPTWVTLHKLLEHESVDEAMAWVRARQPEDYRTRMITLEETLVLLWHGDELLDGAEGDRHRLFMIEGAWRYERR